jgi:hypothetical protein
VQVPQSREEEPLTALARGRCRGCCRGSKANTRSGGARLRPNYCLRSRSSESVLFRLVRSAKAFSQARSTKRHSSKPMIFATSSRALPPSREKRIVRWSIFSPRLLDTRARRPADRAWVASRAEAVDRSNPRYQTIRTPSREPRGSRNRTHSRRSAANRRRRRKDTDPRSTLPGRTRSHDRSLNRGDSSAPKSKRRQIGKGSGCSSNNDLTDYAKLAGIRRD